MCRVQRVATQSIANNIDPPTAVNWDTRDVNTDLIFPASGSQNFVTIRTAGVYLITATLRYVLNSTSTRGLIVYHGATLSGSADSSTVTAGTRITGAMLGASPVTQSVLSASTILSCAVNDILAVGAYQNSGSALDLSTLENTFSLYLIGRVS